MPLLHVGLIYDLQIKCEASDFESVWERGSTGVPKKFDFFFFFAKI